MKVRAVYGAGRFRGSPGFITGVADVEKLIVEALDDRKKGIIHPDTDTVRTAFPYDCLLARHPHPC